MICGTLRAQAASASEARAAQLRESLGAASAELHASHAERAQAAEGLAARDAVIAARDAELASALQQLAARDAASADDAAALASLREQSASRDAELASALQQLAARDAASADDAAALASLREQLAARDAELGALQLQQQGALGAARLFCGHADSLQAQLAQAQGRTVLDGEAIAGLEGRLCAAQQTVEAQRALLHGVQRAVQEGTPPSPDATAAALDAAPPAGPAHAVGSGRLWGGLAVGALLARDVLPGRAKPVRAHGAAESCAPSSCMGACAFYGCQVAVTVCTGCAVVGAAAHPRVAAGLLAILYIVPVHRMA